jgi:lon-related putative ATP-dependent protease
MTASIESSSTSPPALPISSLRRTCDLSSLRFERSDQLQDPPPHLGQQRATDAIRFAIQMADDSFNAVVLGPDGSNRHGLAAELVRDAASTRPPPEDWCYVNNLEDQERPRALSFPAGEGAAFRDDLRHLIEDLRLAIPAAFEGDEYRGQLKAIDSAMESELEERQQALEERAARENIGIMQTPTGFVLAPLREGKVIDEDDFRKLPEEERGKIQEDIRHLTQELQAQIEQMPQLRKRHREEIKQLNRTVTSHAVSVLLHEVKDKYASLPEVTTFLDAIERDIIENAEHFRELQASPHPFPALDASRLYERYEVNLLVHHEADAGAPVVYEPNPAYQNLIGRIEHKAEMGALLTDYRLVRAGALLRANGGFLILDIERLLTRPFVWEALKQALFARQVRIESPGDTWGLVSTATLRPDPIPLRLRVILIGERRLYDLLCRYDSEFGELFKVAADLEDELPRSEDNDNAYARLVAARIRQAGLLPFDRQAVERVVEERARDAEDSERLSLYMRSLNDLLAQADHWARHRGASVVETRDLDQAIEEHERRLSRIQMRVLDEMRRETLLIDTSGSRIGQINGLSVAEFAGYRFGHPVRITATTRMGTGDLVDIEREVDLGGAIHSKGMLILSSALAARYAPSAPFSLQGSVVFEQSYGGVEGDSASVAELCALLSSLSRVPILQNLAVTGSVNQHGRVQVVGGINEKVEGFFDLCKARGLDGSHGVIIPRENVNHLMLKQEVVKAVGDGQFAVYSMSTIDDALTVLTGVPAGERDERGEFPPGSVNFKVERQLLQYAETRKEFGEHTESNGHG